jgi:hypothetical protein
MSGWHQKRQNGQRSYICQTHKSQGTCNLNRVRHEVLEALVVQFLDESHQAITSVLADTPLPYWLEPEEPDPLLDPKLAYMRAMHDLWQQVRASGQQPPPGEAWTAGSLTAAYRAANPSDLGKILADTDARRYCLVALKKCSDSCGFSLAIGQGHRASV